MVNTGIAAQTSTVQEGLATTGARENEGGHVTGEETADDCRKSEERAEEIQPASLILPAPEVIVQEKIVERVVVEEKVRVLRKVTV